MFSYAALIQQNFEAVRILHIIVNALGASFYYLNTSKNKFTATLYSIVILLLFILPLIMGIFTFPKMSFSAPFAAICVFKLCETTIPIFVIFQSLSGGKYLKTCVDDIIFTDKLLHIAGIGVDYAKTKQIVRLTFICSTVYVFFVLGSNFLFVIHLSKRFSVLVVTLLYIFEASHVLYNIYLNYFFCVLLIIFKQRFKKLNSEILCLASPTHEESVRVITVKPYKQDSSALEKIKTIKFVHAVYRQIVLDHNTRFGFVVLLQFVQTGAMLILCIYFMFINIKELKDSVIFSILFASILRCSTSILSTIFCCVITSSEANKMGNVVHEQMSETEDRQVFQELENFSVELLHAKVEFTAYGFYTIDYSLFTKLVGSVVSYVIIFLQLGGSNSNYGGIFDLKVNQTTSYSN